MLRDRIQEQTITFSFYFLFRFYWFCCFCVACACLWGWEESDTWVTDHCELPCNRVLGIEPGSPGRTTSIHNHLSTSPAARKTFLSKIKLPGTRRSSDGPRKSVLTQIHGAHIQGLGLSTRWLLQVPIGLQHTVFQQTDWQAEPLAAAFSLMGELICLMPGV